MANDCPACGAKNTVLPTGKHNERYACLNCAMFYIIRPHPVSIVIKHQGKTYSSIDKAEKAMQKDRGIS